MALPRIIEYLASIRREGGGGPLITLGQTQVIVQAFPPGVTITLQEYPSGTDYMNIVFMLAWDPSIVPNAFYAVGSYFGAPLWQGIAHSWWMQNNVYGFVFVTEAEPAYALIYNRSPLTQYYAGTTSHLVIHSKADFDTMYSHIALMATSKESNALAVEANSMLRQLNGLPALAPDEPIV